MNASGGSVGATTDVPRAAVALRDPRRAIADDEILCLVCGAGFRHLTNTHLAGHGLTSMEYKRRFGYNVRRPLMCRALVRFYAERAIRSGLAALIRRRPILGDPGLRRVGGARPIAREERLTRQDVQRRPRRRWSARDERGRFVPAEHLVGSGGGLPRRDGMPQGETRATV